MRAAGVIRRDRLQFENEYTQVPNTWARDRRVSHRARGILLELLSHREGFMVSVEGLVTPGERAEAVRTAVRQLESAGYLTRRRTRDAEGRLAGTEWRLSDPFATPTGDDRP